MPELPDVEQFRRYLEAHALHQKIADVVVATPRILDHVTPDAVRRELRGRELTAAVRYGKNLLAPLRGGGVLVYHFGMTGYLKYFGNPDDDTPYDRFLLLFENGSRLAYDNRRMIGHVGLAESVDSFIALKGLGPDALTIRREDFVAALSEGRRPVKTVLMDQALMAGIGNEYSDEILFQARLHPMVPVSALSAEERVRLWEIARSVLRTALEKEARHEDFPGGWFLPVRGRGGSCPQCGERLRQMKVGGRTGYFCAACQPAPGKELHAHRLEGDAADAGTGKG